MAITTFTELKTAIKNRLHRADLDSVIPEFITQGEEVLNDKLRSRTMRESATLNPSTSNNYTALPTGFLEPILLVDDLGEEVRSVSIPEIEAMRYNNSSGRPEYYAITDQIEFERVAAATYNYTFYYWKKLDIASDDTNAILTNHPNLYLYSALSYGASYINDEQRASYYNGMMNEAIKRINHRENKTTTKLRTDFKVSRFDITRGY